MSTEAIAPIAKQHNVPVMVDAAAEILTIPNVHLQRGATLVGYSGGKFIRGPQSAGLLLGRKDLVKAAWVHSAPHHGYARRMKVGREEVIGMLVAVESWVKRDHQAEWAEWVARCDYIAERVTKIPGVTASVRAGARSPQQPQRARRIAVGSQDKLVSRGDEVADMLDNGGAAHRARRGRRGVGAECPGDTGISITTAMMAARRREDVAEAGLQGAVREAHAEAVEPPATAGGRRERALESQTSSSPRASSTHTVDLLQTGNRPQGHPHTATSLRASSWARSTATA